MGGLLALWTLYLSPLFFTLPDAVRPIAVHGGVDPNHVGLDLNLLEWIKHARMLESTVPFGLLFMPLVGLLAFRSVQRRHLEGSQGNLYALLTFGVCVLAVSAIVNTTGTRIWVFVLPIYALILSASAAMLTDELSGQSQSQPFQKLLSAKVISVCLVAWVVIIFLASSLAFGPVNYFVNSPKEGYGPPLFENTYSKGFGAHHSALQPLIRKEDIIVSTSLGVANYYFGKVDAYLRERRVGTGHAAFESDTDEYFGIQIIDRPAELRELRDSIRRVWVITDFKVHENTSQATKDFLENNFFKYAENPYLTVYVNSRPEMPR